MHFFKVNLSLILWLHFSVAQILFVQNHSPKNFRLHIETCEFFCNGLFANLLC